MLTLLAERFEQCGRVAQIVGPHGTGKSTLLDAIALELRQPVFKIVLRDRQRRLPDIPDEFRSRNSVVIIDGYEQLSTLSRLGLWWKRQRYHFGLLITVHRPVSGYPILSRTEPCREICERILQTLLKNETDFRLCDSLFIKHKGNMRLVFLELYDQWEEASSQ